LDAIGEYFIDTPPTQIDNDYLQTVEFFLNELYKTAYAEGAAEAIHEMVKDALAQVAELSEKLNNSSERDRVFFRTIKDCGEFLQRIAILL
jgi:hypothetical protein